MQTLDDFSTINDVSALGAFNEQWAQSEVELPLVSVRVGGWNLPTLKRVEIDVQDLSYLQAPGTSAPRSNIYLTRVTRSSSAATGSWSTK